jgi:hypothetical protein
MLVVGHQWWRSAIQHDASTKRSAALAILREQVSGPPLYKLGCDRPFKSAELYPCQLVEPPRAARRVLLIGDSVAAQWTPALEVVSRRRDWHLTTLTKAGCPIVDVRIYYARIGREYFECEAWRNLVAGYINRERFDLVIVGSAATYDLTPQQWQLGTHSFLAKIHRAAGTIVLVTPTPVLPFDALDCLLTLDGLAADNLDRCSVARSDAEDIEVSSALKLAAESFSNVRQADFNPLVCPSNRCTVVRHGQLVYRDKVHLNVSFVTGLTDRFESALLSAADGQKAR